VRDKERDVSNTQTTAQKVDSSIKETFWRTTITTGTTLLPIIILTIFGVPLIQEFALPIIFGLLAGTYSTICITSSLYVRFENAKQAKAKMKKKSA
jgi:SecD/SecF fusion protein